MRCCTATTLLLLVGFMLMAAALSHSSAAALDLQQGGSSQKIVVRGRAWDASPSSNVKFDGLLLRQWWHWVLSTAPSKNMTSASTTTVAAAAMDRGDVKLEGRALEAAGGGVQEEPDYAGDYTPSHNVDTGSSPLPSPVKVINGRRLLQDYAPMANTNGSPSVGRKLM